MGRPMRWIAGGIGFLVMLLGLACLNYTKGFDFDHHVQWAREKGVPEPSYGMFVSGLLLTVAGAGTAGFTLAAARWKRSDPGALS